MSRVDPSDYHENDKDEDESEGAGEEDGGIAEDFDSGDSGSEIFKDYEFVTRSSHGL